MSKKRWNVLFIGGLVFELDLKNPVKEVRVGAYGDIKEAYNSPSTRKIGIYNDWWHWFCQNRGKCGVSSKNTHFFSLEGYVTSENGKKYQIRITPTHNYAYEVEG